MDNQRSTTEYTQKIVKLLKGINVPQEFIIGVEDFNQTSSRSLCSEANLPSLLFLLEELQSANILSLEYVQPILESGAVISCQYYWASLAHAVKKVRQKNASLLTPPVIFRLIDCVTHLEGYKMDSIVMEVTESLKFISALIPTSATPSKASSDPSNSKAFNFLKVEKPWIAVKFSPIYFEKKESAIDEILTEIFTLIDKRHALEEVLVTKLVNIAAIETLQFFLKVAKLYPDLHDGDFRKLIVYINANAQGILTLDILFDELQKTSVLLDSFHFNKLIENLTEKKCPEYFADLLKILQYLKDHSLLQKEVIFSLLSLSAYHKQHVAISLLCDAGLLTQESVSKVLLEQQISIITERKHSTMFCDVILYLAENKETFSVKVSVLLKYAESGSIDKIYRIIDFFEKYKFSPTIEQWTLLCEDNVINEYLCELLLFLKRRLDWRVKDRINNSDFFIRIIENLVHVKALYQILSLGLPFFCSGYFRYRIAEEDQIIDVKDFVDIIFSNINHIDTLVKSLTPLHKAESLRNRNEANKRTVTRLLILLKMPQSLFYAEEIAEITVGYLKQKDSDVSEDFFFALVESGTLRAILKKHLNEPRLLLPAMGFYLHELVTKFPSLITEDNVKKLIDNAEVLSFLKQTFAGKVFSIEAFYMPQPVNFQACQNDFKNYSLSETTPLREFLLTKKEITKKIVLGLEMLSFQAPLDKARLEVYSWWLGEIWMKEKFPSFYTFEKLKSDSEKAEKIIIFLLKMLPYIRSGWFEKILENQKMVEIINKYGFNPNLQKPGIMERLYHTVKESNVTDEKVFEIINSSVSTSVDSLIAWKRVTLQGAADAPLPASHRLSPGDDSNGIDETEAQKFQLC